MNKFIKIIFLLFSTSIYIYSYIHGNCAAFYCSFPFYLIFHWNLSYLHNKWSRRVFFIFINFCFKLYIHIHKKRLKTNCAHCILNLAKASEYLVRNFLYTILIGTIREKKLFFLFNINAILLIRGYLLETSYFPSLYLTILFLCLT